MKKNIFELKTHWLFGKKTVPDAIKNKESHADSLLGHEKSITIDFLEKDATVKIGTCCYLRSQNPYYSLKTRRKRSFLLRGAYDKFPDFFFVWALLLIVHTWNSIPLWSNRLRQQCTCSTVPTTSSRPHGSPLVWACQWPSSEPPSSPQFFYNDSFWT